jgi:hypothetical protein
MTSYSLPRPPSLLTPNPIPGSFASLFFTEEVKEKVSLTGSGEKGHLCLTH